MAQSLTNEGINKLLLSLGFEPGELSRTNSRQWRHPQSGCTLLLPANKLQEPPRPADLAGIKAHLDLQGHLNEGEFERFAEGGQLPVHSSDRG